MEEPSCVVYMELFHKYKKVVAHQKLPANLILKNQIHVAEMFFRINSYYIHMPVTPLMSLLNFADGY